MFNRIKILRANLRIAHFLGLCITTSLYSILLAVNACKMLWSFLLFTVQIPYSNRHPMSDKQSVVWRHTVVRSFYKSFRISLLRYFSGFVWVIASAVRYITGVHPRKSTFIQEVRRVLLTEDSIDGVYDWRSQKMPCLPQAIYSTNVVNSCSRCSHHVSPSSWFEKNRYDAS